jgi:hypothetical protein
MPAALNEIPGLCWPDPVGLQQAIASAIHVDQSSTRFLDRWIIALSRVFDRLFLYSIGKTIMAVWTKTDAVKASDEKLPISNNGRSDRK